MAYIGKGLDNGVRNRFIFAATQGQKIFTGSDLDGKTLTISDALYCDVYHNGVKIKLTTDWSSSTTTMTLVTGASVNDVIEIISFEVFGIPDTVSASSGGNFNGGIGATTGTFTGSVGIGTASTDSIRLQAVTPTANHIGLQVENSNTADSFGIVVKGGNDANDYTADFRKRDNTNIMRIRGDGNVGIGTTSPNAGLEVLKANGGKIRISETVAKYVEIIGYAEGSANGSTMAFQTNQAGTSTSTERMRINSSGNVGIGTASPECMLHLSGGNEEAKIKFQVGTANADKFKIYASTAGRLYVNSDNGSTGVYLNHNGTSWTSNSDETLKDNITSLGTVSDKLKNYRTSYFNWKADTETPPKRNIGFIAQDWETDFPEVVTKKDGETLGMQYTETIPILLKYIQELEARITALEAE